ncbi:MULTISPECIES: DUF3768 domain-containing protein [Bradyrhizobium]|jgi:hypothetical protein|uniref:DUF3768 domain-containing protein n=2 Tax=Nitrobacteraceae TaxID=41294 RepID=UPI000B18573B
MLPMAGVRHCLTAKAQPLLLVTSFSEFSTENDSHGEHDLGRFSLVGRTFFWKIDNR